MIGDIFLFLAKWLAPVSWKQVAGTCFWHQVAGTCFWYTLETSGWHLFLHLFLEHLLGLAPVRADCVWHRADYVAGHASVQMF